MLPADYKKSAMTTPEQCKSLCTNEHGCSKVRFCKNAYGTTSGKYMTSCDLITSKIDPAPTLEPHANCTDYYKKCHWQLGNSIMGHLDIDFNTF